MQISDNVHFVRIPRLGISTDLGMMLHLRNYIVPLVWIGFFLQQHSIQSYNIENWVRLENLSFQWLKVTFSLKPHLNGVMQSNCKQTWFAVGKFWNFTRLLWNSSHSLACSFRDEFSLHSSHIGQLHLLHRGPLLEPSTGVQHSRQMAGELTFGPIANGSSSKMIEPALSDFVATAYRPSFSWCSTLKWFFVSTTMFFLTFFSSLLHKTTL